MSHFVQVRTSLKAEFHTMLSKDEKKRYLHADSQDTGKKVVTRLHVKTCLRDTRNVSLVERLVAMRIAMLKTCYDSINFSSSLFAKGKQLKDKELFLCLKGGIK